MFLCPLAFGFSVKERLGAAVTRIAQNFPPAYLPMHQAPLTFGCFGFWLNSGILGSALVSGILAP
jgi:hypothetical protein